jgi:hypothetical protein
MRIKPWLLAALVILALADARPTAPAGALGAAASVDSRLRLDWELGARHGGRPVIQGYLYNDYLRSAAEVQLLVETLDAAGGVTARQVAFVRGVTPFKDRTNFAVPVKTAGAAYRVSIPAFDWKDCGGGGGGGM